MKILFIAVSNNPFVATQGSSQRSCLLLNALTKVADVDVISFCSTDEPSRNYTIIHQENWKNQCRDGRLSKFRRIMTPWAINSVFNIDQHKQEVIDKAVNNNHYDYIAIRYISSAIECGLWKYRNRLIIDIDDNPIERAKADADAARSLRNKIYLRLYAQALKIVVKNVMRFTKLTFVSNSSDANGNNSILLPNVPYYTPQCPLNVKNEVKGRMLFVGDLGYWVNQEGLSHFLSNVYSKIKLKIPNVELHIVGRIWDDKLKEEWESYEGVKVTGFVPSLIEEYQEAQLSVIPIYHGAGTCIKVVETMQMQKACITTPVGFRGYDSVFIHNEDCIVAQTDEMFVSEIIDLLNDSDKRLKLAQNAFLKQQRFYSKEKFNDIVISSIS